MSRVLYLNKSFFSQNWTNIKTIQFFFSVLSENRFEFLAVLSVFEPLKGTGSCYDRKTFF